MNRLFVLTVTVSASVVSCAESPLPNDFGSEAFWDDIELSQAIDLGHEVRELPELERTPSGPLALVDVGQQAGLVGARSGGNTHGVGASFVDVDGDTWPDIFVVSGRSNRTGAVFQSLLYLNRGDGTFRNATDESGISAILRDRDSYAVAAGDYDRDGDIDLYVSAQPTDVLLRNCGGGGSVCFEDVTQAAGAGGPPSNPDLVGNGKSKIAVFGDYDGDGDLDIASASSTLPAPYAYLLRNQGDGTFVDISAESNIQANPSGNPCAVMWSDYDNDGDADLWIWNDRGGSILLRNESGVRFEDVTGSSRVSGVGITHPMGIDAADIDLDGDLDYYISNIGDNPLLRNNGDGTFVDITRRAGTGGDYGWGLAFEDFDGDMYADIFVAQEDNRPHLLYKNLAGPESTFERIEVSHLPVDDGDAAHNVAVAVADYDRDGRTDVLAAHTDGSPITLYRNQTDMGSNNWLHVIVHVSDGPESWDGVSARIGVKTGDVLQFRDITGGSSRASQNQLSARFGLGNYTGADWVAVVWASGRQIVVSGVEGGQTLVLPIAAPNSSRR